MERSGPHHAAALHRLRTLGALHLPGAPVTRPKPLLVLAYLAHEGPTDRDRLARLFFASNRDPRDALVTTLRRLADLVEPAAPMDGRLRAAITTDALEFQRLAIFGEPQVALAHYRGPFLQGAPMGSGVEADEWIVATREHYGSLARDLHLDLARKALARHRTAAAWHHAKRAIGLTEAYVLEPEPSLEVLHEFDAAGLRVPHAWWRAMAAYEIDRSRPSLFTTKVRAGDRHSAPGGGRPSRDAVRRRTRSPRPAGVRKPRRNDPRP